MEGSSRSADWCRPIATDADGPLTGGFRSVPLENCGSWRPYDCAAAELCPARRSIVSGHPNPLHAAVVCSSPSSSRRLRSVRTLAGFGKGSRRFAACALLSRWGPPSDALRLGIRCAVPMFIGVQPAPIAVASHPPRRFPSTKHLTTRFSCLPHTAWPPAKTDRPTSLGLRETLILRAVLRAVLRALVAELTCSSEPGSACGRVACLRSPEKSIRRAKKKPLLAQIQQGLED